MKFDLLRLNRWRKLIIVAFIASLALMYLVPTGYHFHIGHAVRLFVGAFVFWVVVDRL